MVATSSFPRVKTLDCLCGKKEVRKIRRMYKKNTSEEAIKERSTMTCSYLYINIKCTTKEIE